MREIRTELGYPQLMFAQMLGYSRSQTVSDFELDKKVPPPYALEKTAHLLLMHRMTQRIELAKLTDESD